ncbi:MAG: hypothetical protein BTN85_1934 [Candidatus Methanohalarchaeum thermophilum]|uniref:Uncharacterized protein n=1 Tax=Methanohalarchaeum thermophilum TaxID=1903181 RepID=A0A1Q6DSD9_METT1|nr:MAG: hypothetical protein BTN85_1934 [Candidatus Methanohalarchaeum thermophilum]
MNNEKPPSRKKYEKNNPVVGFRISKESKKKLNQIVEELDTTKKEWLEKVIRNEERDIERAKKKAKKGSWERGYNAAVKDGGMEEELPIYEIEK